MKKYLKYVPFFALAVFFFFPSNASAKSVTINFDVSERFNYFYEYKNNSMFFNFLLKENVHIVENLYSINSKGSSLENSSLRIFLVNEFTDSSLSFVSEANPSIFSKAKYVIARYDSSNITIKSEDGDLCYYSSSSGSCGSFPSNTVFYFFDSDSNYLFSYSDYYTTDNLKLKKLSYDIEKEFTYFISSNYYSIRNFSTTTSSKLVVTNVITDGNNYIIDDNENYSSLLLFFKSLSPNQEVKDFSDSFLDYYRKNVVLSTKQPLRHLYSALNFLVRSVDVPDSYTFKTLDSDASVFIVPKSKEISDLSKLYISSQGKHNLSVRYYSKLSKQTNSENQVEWVEGDNLKYYKDFEKSITVKKINIIGEFPILTADKMPTGYDLPTKNYYDYIYHVINHTYWEGGGSLFGEAEEFKYPITIYYDPNFYDLIVPNKDGVSFKWLDGIDYTITADDIKASDRTGVSVDIFEDSDIQVETAQKYSEIYEYDEDGNIIGIKGFEANGVSFFKFFNSAYYYIDSFVKIVRLVFYSLPPEIVGLFHFLLVATVVLIIKKLFS